MRFLKMVGTSYLFGMASLLLFMTVYSLVASDWMEFFYWIHTFVSIPFTPVGLPFFIGSMFGAKFYFDRSSQKG